MGGEEVLSDALRPIMDYLMKEILAAQVSAEWHLWNRVVTNTQGSCQAQSNNCKQTAGAECEVEQGYLHLHETLRSHQCYKYEFENKQMQMFVSQMLHRAKLIT